MGQSIPAMRQGGDAGLCGQASGAPSGRFVTGATGFIGRHLVARLLARSDAPVYVLVRESSLGRLAERCREWRAPEGRIVPVLGDLTAPGLGLSADAAADLRGRVGSFFHVGALYDMTASDQALERSRRPPAWARAASTT
jgi:thioester reductase-like protein